MGGDSHRAPVTVALPPPSPAGRLRGEPPGWRVPEVHPARQVRLGLPVGSPQPGTGAARGSGGRSGGHRPSRGAPAAAPVSPSFGPPVAFRAPFIGRALWLSTETLPPFPETNWGRSPPSLDRLPRPGRARLPQTPPPLPPRAHFPVKSFPRMMSTESANSFTLIGEASDGGTMENLSRRLKASWARGRARVPARTQVLTNAASPPRSAW